MINNTMTKEQLIELTRTLQERINGLEEKLTAQSLTRTALRASEANQSVILEKNPDGIIIIDTDGVVLYVNPAAEKLFGKSKEDFLGYPFGFPVSGNESEKSLDIVIRKGDTFCDAELRMVQVQWRNRPAFQLSVRDITERKRAEQQLSFQAKLLANVDDAIVASDIQYRLTAWNAAAESLYGWKAEEVLGKNGVDLLRTEWPGSETEQMRRMIAETGRWRGEATQVRKDGTRISVEVASITLRDTVGQITGYVSVNHNITERKRAEKALIESERFARSTLDGLSSHIAIIRNDGTIEVVNNAWRDFAKANLPVEGNVCEGANYLAVCDNAVGPDSELAALAAKGIREVFAKQIYEFQLEYPCHSPEAQRWFVLHATLFPGDGPARVVVAHENVTEHKRADEALHRSEQSLSEAQRIAHIGSHEYDVRSDKLYWSDEVFRIFGLAPREITPTVAAFFERIHPDDRERVRQIIEETIAAKKRGEIEHRIDRRDGTVRIVQERFEAMYENGQDVRHLGTIQDITERKQVEDDVRKYGENLMALNDASNSIVGIVGTEDLFKAICDNALKLFKVNMVWLGLVREGNFAVIPVAHAGAGDGYLSAITVTWDDSPLGMGPGGMSIKTRMPHMLKVSDALFAPWVQEAKKRGFQSVLGVPLMHSTKGCIGSLVFHSTEPDLFTEDVIRLCQIFANQAATAIENAELVEGLEEKIQERTRQLEDANMEFQTLNRELEMRRMEAEGAKMIAMSSDKAKSEFLANMSHELRTPLNSILGFSELMISGKTGVLDPKQLEYLKDINESGALLLSLINDILDLSKVEAGKMELEYEEVGVRNVIDRVLIFFKEKMMKHGVQIAVEIEAGIGAVLLDERRIKQVLLNLLSNAVKFTPDGGAVRVSARMTRDETDKIVNRDEGGHPPSIEISVANTGPSIKAEDISKLFKPFQQLDSSYEKKHQGTGLGLALCKRIVELHGGKIWVTSEAGKETVFTFAIPVMRPEK